LNGEKRKSPDMVFREIIKGKKDGNNGGKKW
jgi:hypothetical protein